MEVAELGATVDSSGVKKGAAEVNKSVKGMADTAEKSNKKMSKGFANLKNQLFSFKALIPTLAIGGLFLDSIKKARQFEQSIAELGSITGATGKDLEFLSDAAKEFGKTTTLSASQAATAFKLVASAKPDLLENADALKAVTEQTIILAEAAGIELPAAADALGASLNQFSAGADEAGRFINVLAAGSKLGSSEISATAAALEKAGVVASVAGLSFEETNAAIQLLAKGAIKGSEAGTGLRGVLLKLTTQANDQFNPAIVGMESALKNLAAAELTATEKKQLFGQESITSAELLLKEANNFNKLTRAMTGTNIAQEQATKNTDTFDGSMKRLASAWEGLMLQINSSNGVLRTFIDLLTKGIDMLGKIGSSVHNVSFEFGKFIANIGRDKTAIERIQEIDKEMVKLGKSVVRSSAAMAKSPHNPLIANSYNAAIEKIKELSAEREKLGGKFITFTPPKEEVSAVKDKKVIKETPAVKQKFDEDAFTAELERQQAFEDQLTSLKLSGLTGRDRAVAEYQQAKKELDTQVLEGEIEGVYEFNALKEQIEINHQQKLVDIDKKASDKKLKDQMSYWDRLFNLEAGSQKAALDFSNAMRDGDLKSALQNGAAMLGNAAKTSKKAFEVQKALALANAVVTLPSAVMKSFEAGGGYPWGLIPAGLMLAQGAQQISAIKSSTFGGGGSITSVGGGGSTSPSAPVASGLPSGSTALPSGEEQQVQQPTQTVNITLEGAGYSKENVRELIDNINEEISDGVELKVTA